MFRREDTLRIKFKDTRYYCVDFICVTQNKGQRQALVGTTVNIQVKQKTGTFLSS